MKTILIALTALAISTSAVFADPAMPSHLTLALSPSGFMTQKASVSSMAPLTLALTSNAPMTDSKLDSRSHASFAQLGTTNQSMPIPSGLALALVAAFVLAMRIMRLNHARAMADHERNFHHGKAQMFRTLHEGGADH